jgi:hypothetical protein
VTVPETFPPGPYKLVTTSDDKTAPWYVIPFDKNGTCTAPLTRTDLIEAISKRKFTDVFLFSHGWNNDWNTASSRYEDFVAGFVRMRRDFELKVNGQYAPLLIGIFWPSTALVMPWERAPKFAGAAPGIDGDTDSWRREVEELGQVLTDSDRSDLYSLAQKNNLNDAESKRMAEIVAEAVKGFDKADTEGPRGPEGSPTADELLIRAKRMPRASATTQQSSGAFSFAKGPAAEPTAALSLGDLDPRILVRLATVLQMKDRAARVGAQGVATLLRDALEADSSARVHLIGHSYGAIVVLSALCADSPLTSPVHSVLLLQPAVSQWCFAANVLGKGYPGGYSAAVDRNRVKGSIFTTFSKNDAPLTLFFHLAARRARDLGQPKIAGSGPLPPPPSDFAALGGFGPAGVDADLTVLRMTPPPTPYASDLKKICALNGDVAITGHGEISVPATWWALFQQLG